MATQFDAAQAGGSGPARFASSLSVMVREFLRKPSLVGSAFPASRHLVDALLNPVDWSSARLVVEYGPGCGPLTRAILEKLPRDSRLVAIDVSRHFTRHLRDTIDDPRLIAVTGCAGSAETVLARHGLGPADAIVTGIPFSTMPRRSAARILDVSAQVLRDDGQLLAYQMRSTVAPMLAERFSTLDTAMAWRNIPPCRLYWARGPVA